MKKFITLLLFSVAFFALPALAQTDPAPPAPIDFTMFFVSIIGLAQVFPIITEFILKLFGSPSGGVAKFVSWVIPMILSFVGYFMKIGYWADMGIITTIVTGAMMSLASNGIFSFDYMQSILAFIGLKISKNK